MRPSATESCGTLGESFSFSVEFTGTKWWLGAAFGKPNTPEEMWLMPALLQKTPRLGLPVRAGTAGVGGGLPVAEDPLPFPAWQRLAGSGRCADVC